MELSTILKRYANLCYEPKGVDRDLEVDSILMTLNMHIFVVFVEH